MIRRLFGHFVKLLDRNSFHKPSSSLGCRRPLQFLRVIVAVVVSTLLFVALFVDKRLVPFKKTATFSEHVRDRIRNLLSNDTIRFRQQPNGTIRPFVRASSVYLVSVRYNLSIVCVAKVMSTAMFNTKCIIDHTEKFANISESIPQMHWITGECQPAYQMISTPEVYGLLPTKHPTLILVRDPFTRFISAFVHLCLKVTDKSADNCFGCEDDLQCVVDILYNELQNISLSDGNNFNHYSKYLSRDFFRAHFLPQTWYGDVGRRFENYDFVRYSSEDAQKELMVQDLQKFFRAAGVEKEKLKILRKYHRGEFLPEHATHKLAEPGMIREKILNSTELLKKIENMYYYDFVVYGFPFPSQSNGVEVSV